MPRYIKLNLKIRAGNVAVIIVVIMGDVAQCVDDVGNVGGVLSRQ